MKRRTVRAFGALLCLISGHLSAPAASLTIDRADGLARIGLSGSESAYYTILGATNADAADWELLAGFSYPHAPWYDADSVLLPQRFYQSAEFAEAPFEFAHDFRLMDHAGRSRSLYYHFNDPAVRAVVLIFTGNSCSKVREMMNTVKALNNRFGSQVLFWLVDSNDGSTRSNLIAEAVALGLPNNLPILHDPAQVVARTYKASKTPEAVGVDTATLTIFYRGAIDDRLSSNAIASTQHYLSNAVANFVAGQHISLIRSRPSGCDINYRPSFPNISYSTEIAPLLQAKCVTCHSPGNIAPWAMTNYDVVTTFAGAIKHQVMAGHMPPWHADNYYQSYTNDFSLSVEETRKLIQWVDEGAPRGSGPDPLLNVPQPPPDWPLGTPDFIITLPVEQIPATGEIPYRYRTISLPANFPSSASVRAGVFRPGNRKVVHHCLVFVGTSHFGGGLGGFFTGYVPGYDPVAFPANTGKALGRSDPLTFQLHYTATGTNETDQSQLGLYLHSSQPPLTLQTRSAYTTDINIPPGAPEYIRSAEVVPSATRDIWLYELSPHMHLRGSWFRYEALYPDQRRETLLSVPFYEFHWQTLYRLAQPKRLPAGTKIICTGAFDNSAQNHHNPDPSAQVRFGDQTDDEMFIGYFNFAEITP